MDGKKKNQFQRPKNWATYNRKPDNFFSGYGENLDMIAKEVMAHKQLKLSDFEPVLKRSLADLRLEEIDEKAKPVDFLVGGLMCIRCQHPCENTDYLAEHVLEKHADASALETFRAIQMVPKSVQDLIDQSCEDQQKRVSLKLSMIYGKPKFVLLIPASSEIFKFVANTSVRVQHYWRGGVTDQYTFKFQLRAINPKKPADVGELMDLYFVYDGVQKSQQDLMCRRAAQNGL